MKEKNVRGQVTIFIIVAIVIVGGVIAYFSLRDDLGRSIPEDMRPVYDYYISCLEATTKEGVALLGEQGGYIELPDFEPGSAYAPSSSQLSFFGQAVPYWMYVSGNNFLKEQVPTKNMMEKELGDYISRRLDSCDFSDFEKMGYDVYIEFPRDDSADPEGVVVSEINDLDIDLDINNRMTIFKGEQSVVVANHDFSVKSKLGKFFGMAIDVYNYEKAEMFLEKYALDVMRLYAPVDGVELSCTPKFFVDEEIRQGLYEGLEANMNSIRLKGGYYKLSSQEREYFVSDVGFDVDENVNIMYDSDWPTRIEIYGDRVANPVGTQPGLSILGFCYVPYHLVYDISFPVMIQFYNSEEFFQFPVSVIIDNSQPREAMSPSFGDISLDSEVCRHKNSEVLVYTYDSELNPVEARLQFKCLGSICEIGQTELRTQNSELDENSELRTQNSEGEKGYRLPTGQELRTREAVYSGEVPQCVNGFIIASAEGYANSKFQISTNSESIANIILRKEYEIGLDLGEISGTAVVSFAGEDYSATVMYPEMKDVTLVEGEYDVSVYVYENSTLTFEGYNRRMCVDVPVSGFGGLVGLEEEKCYDVDIPSMQIDMAVVGGGKSTEYITESMLADLTELNLNVPLFGRPASLDELQENYVKAEESRVFLEFE